MITRELEIYVSLPFSLEKRSGPRRLALRTWSHSSGSSSKKGVRRRIPAALARKSTPLKKDTVSEITFWTTSSSAASPTKIRTSAPPRRRMLFSVSLSPSSFRSTKARLAPFSASDKVAALPIPLPAPVRRCDAILSNTRSQGNGGTGVDLRCPPFAYRQSMGRKTRSSIPTFTSALLCPPFLSFHDPDVPQPWSPSRQDPPALGSPT